MIIFNNAFLGLTFESREVLLENQSHKVLMQYQQQGKRVHRGAMMYPEEDLVIIPHSWETGPL